MDDGQKLNHLRWLVLSRLPDTAVKSLISLLAQFPSLIALLQSLDSLPANLPDKLVSTLKQLASAQITSPFLLCQDDDWQWLQRHNGIIVDWYHSDYPALLKQLPDPPLVLFCRGDTTLLGQPQLAIVGSRGATKSGLELARLFAADLAKHGFVVTSGLAVGIDGSAHRGALATGKTIAVVGTGLDINYPKPHRALIEDILQQGLVVSELPLGSPPLAFHFPRRNRLIAGLSLGTLVVEAKVKSGSLITAKLAMESGREVFAMPGSIHNPLSRGPHQLIQQGATLVQTSADIVAQLSAGLSFLAQTVEAEPEPLPTIFNSRQQKLLAAMGFDIMCVDDIVLSSNMDVAEVGCLLLELELAGAIIVEAGGYQKVTVI